MSRGRAACGLVVPLMVALGWASAGAQAPSGSAEAWVSPAPWDVSALRWTRSDVIDRSGDEIVVNDLAVGPDGRILLVGGVFGDGEATAGAWSSSDGLVWSRLDGEPLDGADAVDVLASDDDFLVVTRGGDGGRGRLFRADGMTLVPLEAPSGDLSELGRSRAGLHALGGEETPMVWTSTDDGATWTPVAITTEDALGSHLAVADDGTIVVLGAVRQDEGERVTAWSSVDGGATWTAATLPLEGDGWLASDVARTPIGLVARVVDPITDMGVNLRSADGVTWEVLLETPGRGSVGTAGSEAIVFGTDAAWHSPDGRTWTEERWPTLNGIDIVASDVMPDGWVVATGNGEGQAPSPPASFVGSQKAPDGSPAASGGAPSTAPASSSP